MSLLAGVGKRWDCCVSRPVSDVPANKTIPAAENYASLRWNPAACFRFWGDLQGLSCEAGETPATPAKAQRQRVWREKDERQSERAFPLRGEAKEASPARTRGKQSARLSAVHVPQPQRGVSDRSPNPLHYNERKAIMSENRKRNQTLSIRLTPAEKDAIVKQAAKARMSLTDYILTSALVTEIHVAEDTRPLITELKRIGNNLNQISTKINVGAFQSYNFQEVIDQQKLIYEELYRIGRGGVTWQP